MQKRSLKEVIEEKAQKDPGFAIAYALLELRDSVDHATKTFSAHAYENMLGDKANSEALTAAVGGIGDSIYRAAEQASALIDPVEGASS